ncbi:hypothetical protein [Micavibrio aeruginosavorus]|uniref:Uncharacterized protein n=1 Tax=Micavibrio aeruginosavorus (strain ARL-13) TaxID=856793 RepID=G2KP21_MICAA|nr:hypothetical protein [Micavibrio aeruginosavorus]AEP08529.1 hypothetical protein MICA_183 [Micavibrio aeruginosavorus ARL-13]
MEKNIGQKICNILFSENLYFEKTSGDLEIFYPWCGPGDAFYINKEQKRWILLFIRTSMALFLSSAVLLTALSEANAVSFDKLFYAGHLFLWVSFSVLCGSLLLFGRLFGPFIVPAHEQVKRTPSWIWGYLFIFSAWLLILLMGYAPISNMDSHLLLMGMVAMDGIFAALSGWLLWRSKTTGLYFFT